MNVKNIVNDFLIDACPMHKMRRLALVEYINSIINGNSLTVTSMGRGIEKLRRHLRITQTPENYAVTHRNPSRHLQSFDNIYSGLC
jgi:hypothetical protein